MSESNFRATFSADDSSFNSTMRKMRAESQIMATDMISDANKVASATKQSVNRVLQEQIALYEKRRELTKTTERMQLDATFGAKLSGAPAANQSGIQAQWETAKKQLEEQFKRDDLQADLLREIISTLKETAVNEMVSNSDAVKEAVNAVNGGRTSGMTPDQEYKARIQSEISRPENRPISMWDVAKGTMAGQVGARMLEGGAAAFGHMVGSGSGDMAASRMLSFIPGIGGGLSSLMGQNVQSQSERDVLAGALNARGSNIGMLGLTDDQILEAASKRGVVSPTYSKDKNGIMVPLPSPSIPLQTSMGTFTESEYTKNERIIKEYKESIENNMDKWSYEGAGYSNSQFLEETSKIVSASGRIALSPNLTREFINMTKGGGISEETGLGVLGLSKLGGTDPNGAIGRIVGTLGKAVDGANRDTEVSGVVGLANSMFSRGFTDVDVDKMAQLKGAFNNTYGVGRAASSNQSIEGLMSHVANPQNGIMQGVNFQIYAQQMAEEGKAPTYAGFMRWQEQPQEGLLRGRMNFIKNLGLSGDNEAILAKNMLGGTWQSSLDYATKGLGDFKGGASVDFDASSNKITTDLQRQQARMTDAVTDSMSEGIAESFKQLGHTISAKGGLLAPFGAMLTAIGDEMSNNNKSVVDKSKHKK